MPLTESQARIGRLLAGNRSEDSYLAGAAAIMTAPNTLRFSHDLDYFHDTTARMASAFATGHGTLVSGYSSKNVAGLVGNPAAEETPHPNAQEKARQRRGYGKV